MLWFVLLLLGVGAAASDASEPAYWTGRIEQDTTWRDTVYVGGDVTIAAAATLTLAPNTQVLFLPYHDASRGGLDSTRAELIVEGRLAAHTGGIIFRSADAGSSGADWHGLVVKRGGRADVSYAVIRDGLRCLYAERGGRVTMDAVAFANCGKPTTPADAAKPATAAGTERNEDSQRSAGQETTSTTLIMGGLSHSAAARDSTQVDSGLSIEAEPVDAYFLNDRAITRIPTRGGVGVLTMFGVALVTYEMIESEQSGYMPGAGAATLGILFGYPLGVYLADPVESSCWMTFVGYGLALGGWATVGGSKQIGGVVVFGAPIMASELSRRMPKRLRNPNPFKWLFGKFGQPIPRVSLGLVPDPQRGLSARATLRF